MSSEWQELDKLRKDVGRLKTLVARQEAIIAGNQRLGAGKIVQKEGRNYNTQEIGVTEEKENMSCNVHTLPGDPGQRLYSPGNLLIDSQGKKFILPAGDKVVTVYDNGDGTGKLVEISTTGGLSYPDGTSNHPMIVCDPLTQFHDGKPPWKLGRIHYGVQKIDETGEKYFIAFAQGFGKSAQTITVNALASEISFHHDTAGHLISIEAETTEIIYSDFWCYNEAGDKNWHALTEGPPKRYRHGAWQVGGSDYYVLGGYGSGDTKLNDLWKWTVTGTNTGYWTQKADCPTAIADIAITSKSFVDLIIVGDGGCYKYDMATDTWTTKTSPSWSIDSRFSEYITPNSGYWLNKSLFVPIWHTLSDSNDYRIYDRTTNSWLNGNYFNGAYTKVKHYAFGSVYYYGGEDVNTGLAVDQMIELSGTSVVQRVASPQKTKKWAGGFISSVGEILFGGVDENENVLDKTWKCNYPYGSTWTDLAPSTTPPARYWHSMGCQSDINFFMFGGKG